MTRVALGQNLMARNVKRQFVPCKYRGGRAAANENEMVERISLAKHSYCSVKNDVTSPLICSSFNVCICLISNAATVDGRCVIVISIATWLELDSI